MNLTEFMNEAEPDLGKAAQEYASLTNSNNHTEAWIVKAKVLKSKVWVKSLEAIEVITRNEGSVPNGIVKYRDADLGKRIDALGERKFGKKSWTTFFK
jgi:hypothetical protein